MQAAGIFDVGVIELYHKVQKRGYAITSKPSNSCFTFKQVEDLISIIKRDNSIDGLNKQFVDQCRSILNETIRQISVEMGDFSLPEVEKISPRSHKTKTADQ